MLRQTPYPEIFPHLETFAGSNYTPRMLVVFVPLV
jgi:hypothetical protein